MPESTGRFAVSRREQDSARSLIAVAAIVSLGAGTMCQAADQSTASDAAPVQTASQAQSPPAPAAVTDPPSGKVLGEVLVTARKRTENILNVPESVVAISASTMADAHVTTLDDIGALAPNLNMFENHDNTPAATMRGVGAFELVQGVGFYVDDVQLFDGQTIHPTDIDQVQVLEGPQGTLYGGANIGGAIKYTTKDPSDQWSGEATTDLGQYVTRNYEGVVSGPLLSDGRLGMRLSLYDQNNDGYIYNDYRHITLGHMYDHGGRLALASELSPDTKVHVYLSADDLNTGNQNLMYTPPDDHTYSYHLDYFYTPSYLRRLWSTTVRIDHQFGDDLQLTSLTSYFSSLDRGDTDFAKKPLPIDLLQQNADLRVYTQELRLASTGGSNFNWVAGLYFEGQKNIPDSMDNFSTGDPSNPIVVSTDLDRDKIRQRRYAAFADGTYRLDNWSFELGLREEYYTSAEQAYNTADQPTFSGYERIVGNEVTPRVSVKYTFSPTLNAYGTVARGFQPAENVEENGIIHRLKPELATSYEVGLKALLEHRVRLTGALFYIDYANRWFQQLRVVNGGLEDVTSNVGTSHNYGAELDVTALLPYGFELTSVVGVTRAIWTNIPFIDPRTNQTVNLDGRTAPFTPIYTGNLGLDWNHAVAGNYTFGARVGASFTGRSYWDPQDSASQSAYQLLNVGAWLQNDTWRVGANVSNVTGTRFNREYFPNWDTGAPINFANMNRPRWFTVTATVHF